MYLGETKLLHFFLFLDHSPLNTVKLGYKELLARDRPFLFVITGVRYYRVNLSTKMTNLFVIAECPL